MSRMIKKSTQPILFYFIEVILGLFLCLGEYPLIAQNPIKFKDPKLLENDLLRIGISNSKLKQLEGLGIKTHADLVLKFQQVKGVLNEKQFQGLKKASIAIALTDNENLRKVLEKKEFNSVEDLSKFTPQDFKKWSGDIIPIEEADAFLKRTIIYSGIVNTIKNRYIVESRNPVIFGKPGGGIGPGTRIPFDTILFGGPGLKFPQFEPTEPCVECDDESSIFSPGVYVLYLLDLVSKVFTPEFNQLEAINHRFYQRMEDVPVFQDDEGMFTEVCHWVKKY